jgi:orotidine-5'-phosphate decarboxylase
VTSIGRHEINVRERLIFALDVPSVDDALALVDELDDAVTFYKLGLELFMGATARFSELTQTLAARGKKIMVDLKFFDVPETVGRAVARVADLSATFATVHGNDGMIDAAVRAADGVRILAVTALTSLDHHDLEALGFRCDVHELVLSRATRALELGCDGVVSSGLEAPYLRREHGDRLIVVTPGIRPVVNRQLDDQKRTVDIATAFRNGADYIVVGRPIRDASDRRQAALDCHRLIEEALSP